jgi:hypothetical protein
MVSFCLKLDHVPLSARNIVVPYRYKPPEVKMEEQEQDIPGPNASYPATSAV